MPIDLTAINKELTEAKVKAICAFTLSTEEQQELTMPLGSKFLSAAVSNQSGAPCLYYLIDPSNEPAIRQIRVVATGKVIPSGWAFLGTLQVQVRPLASGPSDSWRVVHIFDATQ